jgi:ribosome-binding factor A
VRLRAGSREFFVSNRNRSRNGRARGAHPREESAEVLFEQALRGSDGVEGKAFDPRLDRKTLQLCRQVQRALMLALAGECGDELLRDVSVDSVQPAGGAGHLLVLVSVPVGLPVMEIVARLNDRAGKLRAIVAGSICRKRTPMLSFIAIPVLQGGRP